MTRMNNEIRSAKPKTNSKSKRSKCKTRTGHLYAALREIIFFDRIIGITETIRETG